MIKKIIGIFLAIVGICGLFLPLVPGVVLIIAGAVLIGNKKLTNAVSRWIKRFKRQR